MTSGFFSSHSYKCKGVPSHTGGYLTGTSCNNNINSSGYEPQNHSKWSVSLSGLVAAYRGYHFLVPVMTYRLDK